MIFARLQGQYYCNTYIVQQYVDKNYCSILQNWVLQYCILLYLNIVSALVHMYIRVAIHALVAWLVERSKGDMNTLL